MPKYAATKLNISRSPESYIVRTIHDALSASRLSFHLTINRRNLHTNAQGNYVVLNYIKSEVMPLADMLLSSIFTYMICGNIEAKYRVHMPRAALPFPLTTLTLTD